MVLTTNSTTYTPSAELLRKLLSDAAKTGVPLACPGVYDGLTARIAIAAGHKALYMTGAGTTASVLGQADLGLITLTEMAGNARMLASLDSSVPVIADADTGFGAPLNVARTIREYIAAGVAGCHIEDQVVAKRCGHLGSKVLVSREEFWLRIRAAVRARRETGRDIVIFARSDALQGEGLEEAMERLRGAVREGADGVFLEGVRTVEQGRQLCREMGDTPCLFNVVAGGVSPNLSLEEAGRIGYRLVIWPCAALTEVYIGVKKAMEQLRGSGKLEERKDGAGGVRDIFNVCGLAESAAFDSEVGGSAYGTGV